MVASRALPGPSAGSGGTSEGRHLERFVARRSTARQALEQADSIDPERDVELRGSRLEPGADARPAATPSARARVRWARNGRVSGGQPAIDEGSIHRPPRDPSARLHRRARPARVRGDGRPAETFRHRRSPGPAVAALAAATRRRLEQHRPDPRASDRGIAGSGGDRPGGPSGRHDRHPARLPPESRPPGRRGSDGGVRQWRGDEDAAARKVGARPAWPPRFGHPCGASCSSCQATRSVRRTSSARSRSRQPRISTVLSSSAL